MNNYDELEKALVGLSNAAAGVREQLMHLPQLASDNGECLEEFTGKRVHKLISDDWLDFEDGKEVIEVKRLLRIIANAAKASNRLDGYVKSSIVPSEIAGRTAVPKSAARNYSATLRDSLGSLATLLGAEPTNDRFLEEENKTVNDVLDDAEKLTLAFVYQRLKTLRNNLNAYLDSHEFQDIINEISSLMDEIQEGKPNGQ